MESITITIDDEVYRVASEEAARRRRSLSELAQEFIEWMSVKWAASMQLGSQEAETPREEFRRFLAELDSISVNDGDSVGPLRRQEQPGLESRPAPEAEELQKKREAFTQFFADLNVQPRQSGPSVGPLNREEIYQRGIC
jgi:predicted CopG family antitoxin